MDDSQPDFSGADEIGHTHADVSGGSLRAAVFGAMDGLVTNISLIAGVGAAGATPHTIILTGMAGLVAGAFSMAMGEYASVSTQNDQMKREVSTEREEILENPVAEQAELADLFTSLGMTSSTATLAAREIHVDIEQATWVHVTHELGMDPNETPSPWVAAGSSFVMFALGAVIPLLPYLASFDSLTAGIAFGAVGLAAAGALASRFTVQAWWVGALRQLAFGALAAGATYLVGSWIGVGVS